MKYLQADTKEIEMLLKKIYAQYNLLFYDLLIFVTIFNYQSSNLLKATNFILPLS